MKNLLMLHVTSETGGGPEQAYLLTKGLKELKNDLNVYYIAPNNGPYYKKTAENVKNIYDINLRRLSISSFFKILKIIKQHNIDIIHSHGRGAGVYSRLLGLITRKPVCHTFHGIHFDQYKNKSLKFLIKSIENKLANFSFNIFVSKGEQEIAKKKDLSGFTKKSIIIENGIDINKFKTKKYHTKKLILLTLARINYQKGIDLIIPTAAKLKNNNINFKWLVVGGHTRKDNEYTEKIKKLIKKHKIDKHVILLPSVSKPEKLFSIANLYISSSRWEGLPLSILEGMASCTPIIATNVTGNNDIIKNKQNGLLIPINKFSSSILKIIKEYQSGSHKFARYTNQATKDVNQFNYIKMTKEYINIYSMI